MTMSSLHGPLRVLHRLLRGVARPVLLALGVAVPLLALPGCAAVTVAGAAAGAAISVTGAVVSTGVTVAGKVATTAVDLAVPDDDEDDD